jgi:prevent-host-death family protein
MEVDVEEARARLSELLRLIAAGEEVVITRVGKPVARLVSVSAPSRRALGLDKGLFEVPRGFDQPLPEDLIAEFNK